MTNEGFFLPSPPVSLIQVQLLRALFPLVLFYSYQWCSRWYRSFTKGSLLPLFLMWNLILGGSLCINFFMRVMMQSWTIFCSICWFLFLMLEPVSCLQCSKPLLYFFSLDVWQHAVSPVHLDCAQTLASDCTPNSCEGASYFFPGILLTGSCQPAS